MTRSATPNPPPHDHRGDALLAEVRPYVLAAAARLAGRGVPADDIRQEGLLRALELCRDPATPSHPNPPAYVIDSARYAMLDLLGAARDAPPVAPPAAIESAPARTGFADYLGDSQAVGLLAALCPGVPRADLELAARHYAGGRSIRDICGETGLSHRRVRHALALVGEAITATLLALKFYRRP